MANSKLQLCLRFLTIFYIAFTPTTASSSNSDTDLASLQALKSAVKDPLGSLISWNHTTHFCNWRGIRCGRRHHDRVIEIDLRSQGLVGTLSPHVGNLSFLRTIILQNNTFNGQIPQEIGRLRRVEFIELSNNSFTGAIPKNLSHCPNLVYLNLIDNNLSNDIPTELGSMSKLEALGLYGNKFGGSIPSFIGNMSSLKQLSLGNCGFEGEIPASLGLLQGLRFLQLSLNNLTGTIPSALFNISGIYHFDVSGNRLEGILPSTIGLTLPNLVVFSLVQNRFSGQVPASMLNVSLLKYFLLASNSFTGELPTALGKLTRLRRVILVENMIEGDINSFMSSFINSTNLEYLQFDNNLLTGSLPNSVANLSTQLASLTLQGNRIYGKIPSGIGNLIGLTILDLSINYFEGPIPVAIAKLLNLRYFYASTNRFVDELPSSFGNLTSLLQLRLDGNNFSGMLPPSIGNCTNLLVLDLSNNSFHSFIPSGIMSISALSTVLNLSNNFFEGSIPNEVGSLENLAALDLSSNRLSGPIPHSLSRCLSLEHLSLMGNSLEGDIPSALSALKGLQYLDLSQNNLSGPIPTFLSTFDLQYLNLSFNNLQGEVPTLGIFNNITSVSLDGNKDLCGGISELKLRLCSLARSHKERLSTLLKIVIPILAAGSICLALFAAFSYKQRMSKKNMTDPSLSSFAGVQIMRLSYGDLLSATRGFSEANLLGFGRFGSVYRGILNDGEADIAVKVLNLSVKGASRSFMAECNALRNVRHRNLLKILSVCESIDFQGNEFKALVYELKANGSLEKWLHQNAESNNLDMMQRLNIAVDIAEGIEYLHSGTDKSIVHGDLKPSNILLDEDMNAYVGDFGLAKIITDIIPSHESKSSVGIRGTIGYVPPEYGMSCPVSTQGDAYSYGIMLLEMFTNTRPTDDLFEDRVNLHCFVSAALPDRVMEVVDPQLQVLITKNDRMKKCVASILGIGVSCSKEMPRERISMTDVVTELHKIQKFLST